MADGIDIKGAVPTVMIAAALGAGAALFTDRGTKNAVKYGLVGAGVGAFAHLVLGLSLTGRGGHAVGQSIAERQPLRSFGGHSLPPSRFATWPAKLGRTLSGGEYEVGQSIAERGASRGFISLVRPGALRGGAGYRARGDFEVGQNFMERPAPYTRPTPYMRTPPGGGYRGSMRTRARGAFGVGFDGDDDFLDEDYDTCPFGYTADVWGNCVPIVFSIEREILYLYPEIVLQYPELRMHPERLFHFRPEMRHRYAGVRSAHEMRSRYQHVHRQPPPARPKDAPPASKSVAAPTQQPQGGHGHGGGKHAQAAPTSPPSAPPAHGAPTAHPTTPPGPPGPPPPKQIPPQSAQHAATGWYTPGWQQHFPPIAYEYNHYGPMEYWWVQPDSRFALY